MLSRARGMLRDRASRLFRRPLLASLTVGSSIHNTEPGTRRNTCAAADGASSTRAGRERRPTHGPRAMSRAARLQLILLVEVGEHETLADSRQAAGDPQRVPRRRRCANALCRSLRVRRALYSSPCAGAE